MNEGSSPRQLARLSYLDGFRGLACVMVFFYHYAVNAGVRPFVILGFTGVHLFFVLSGFLLFQPFLKALSQGTPFPVIGTFYLRRFVRIYPPYFVSLILYILVRMKTHTNVPSGSNILAHVFLVSNYINPKLWYSLNAVYWSLAIEMQFYILLPLLCYLFYRLPFARPETRCFACVACFAGLGLLSRGGEIGYWRIHDPNTTDVMFRTIFSYLDLFAVGMLAAILKLPTIAATLRSRLRYAALIVSGLIVTVLANFWCSLTVDVSWLETRSLTFGVLFPMLVCVGWGLLLLANLLYEERSFPFFNRGFFVWAGQISYTIYLYHLGIQFVYLRYIHLGAHIANWNLHNLVESCVALPITLALSVGLYRLVEAPCLAWLNRPSKRLRPAAISNS